MVHPEIAGGDLEAAVLIENPNKQRKCPVCRNNLNLYYINEEQLFLMCENDYCEFPFGYEPLQIVYNESQLVDDPSPCTKDFFEYPVGGIDGVPPTPLASINESTCSNTFSTLPSIATSDQMSLDDLDTGSEMKQEVLSVRLGMESRRRKVAKEANKKMMNNLKHITEMNKELKALDEEDKSIDSKMIKNEKWLKNLKMWEGKCGTQLLTDDEHTLLKKTESELAVGELKISVEPQSSLTSVKVEILAKTVKNE